MPPVQGFGGLLFAIKIVSGSAVIAASAQAPTGGKLQCRWASLTPAFQQGLGGVECPRFSARGGLSLGKHLGRGASSTSFAAKCRITNSHSAQPIKKNQGQWLATTIAVPSLRGCV